jgi:N-acyl-D-aspartate/D-glutamate deacylase
MGARGRANAVASPDDIEKMAAIVEAGISAGAVGFSTSRIMAHRSIHGDPVPGTFADEGELNAMANALRRAGKGVFQVIPASTLGAGNPLAPEQATLEDEVDLICRLSRTAGRPATFTLFQTNEATDQWRQIIDRVRKGNGQGAQVFPQVGSRPTGLVFSLGSYHPFMAKPTFCQLQSLPKAERLAALRRPEVKAKIMAEENIPPEFPGKMESLIVMAPLPMEQTFALNDQSTYEPLADESFAAMASKAGYADPRAYLYDYLVGGDGNQFAIVFFTNFPNYTLDAVREMQMDPQTVTGLSDGGAHVGLIFDAVNPTYQMTYWARDRVRGKTLDLSHVIHRQTARNADLFGFKDRGRIAPGMRADLNVIDFDHLGFGPLELRHDLPAGGARLMQAANGYVATLINGRMTRRHDQDTGARPGRLLRS